MTSVVLTNNAQSALAGAITAAATQLTVTASQGARFPNPGPNEWFPLTLVSADGTTHEIVRATSRTGDTITIQRGRENTTAAIFPAGTFVLHQMTAEAFRNLASSATSATLETSSGTSSAYNVAGPGITSLEDGIAFEWVAHVDNVGSATLRVGTLPATPLRKYAYAGGGTLEPLVNNEILEGRQVLVHYQAADNVFVVSNPNVPESPAASATEPGLVQLATAPVAFDNLTGDDTEAVTQLTASQIAQEAIDIYDTTVTDTPLPEIWEDLGTGAGGPLTVLPGGNASLSAGQMHQFSSIDIQDTGTLDIPNRGLCVIRCTESFNCDGEINFPLGGSIGWPGIVIGPSGGVNAAHDGSRVECNTYPAVNPRRAQQATNNAATIGGFRVTAADVEWAIQNGIPLHQFQGGNGATYRETTQSDHKGGLIIIAPSITFGATSVVNRMHPEQAQDFSSNPRSGPAAGGMLMLVEDNGNAAAIINASALFEASNISTLGTTDQHRTAAQLAGDADAIPGPPGAANGQCVTISRLTGLIQVVF